MPKLYSNDAGLKFIEPAVVSDLVVVVADFAAVISERKHGFCIGIAICSDQSAVAISTKVLTWKETKAANMPNATSHGALVARPE